MKRNLLFLLGLLISANIFSFSVDFYLSPIFGIRESKTNEALYFSGNFGTDKNKKCSLLEWNEKHLMYFGICADIKLNYEEKESFGFLSSFLFSIPFNAGKMNDSDWTSEKVKFNYSIFDCNIAYENFSDNFRNFKTSLEFYYEKDIQNITLKPSIMFRYSSHYFKAENGYGWYGSSGRTSDGKTHEWNSPYSHYFPDGKQHLAGINYQSRTFAISTGFSASFKILSNLDFVLGFALSPYTFVVAEDRHIGNEYITQDLMHVVFGNFEVRTGFDFKMTRQLSADLTFYYSDVQYTKGNEYEISDDDGHKVISSQKAGYSFQSLNCEVAMKFKVF